jgi:hypothetical protein
MFERSSKRVHSSTSSNATGAGLIFGTDLNRDPVYLSGRVIPSQAFAEAMLALGEVVKLQKPVKRDHSAYQEWVNKEYQKTLENRMPGLLKEHSELITTIETLRDKSNRLNSALDPLTEIPEFNTARSKFFDWLYEHDREAWIVLDPIVSVQKDGTFFEAFSGDESVYARVFLPHVAIDSKEKPSLGTTNIDFSLLLEREFDRVRSYRPIDLTVGLKSVDFKTEAATVEEEKIPLPETWVRGLVEVQSVLALAPIVFDISTDGMAEIISRLQGEKEKTGPRSLKFMLKPGQPIRVEIEPWGEVFSDDWFNYEGQTSEEIRIWGRRRLFVLEKLLVHAEKVRVHFLGSGMPSFWTIEKDGVELTVGLSGWSSNDWASKAKFSAFIPVSNVDETHLSTGLDLLVEEGSLTTADVAERLGVSVAQASALLQKLCMQGKAMFDPSRGIYRWRDLFPTLDVYEDDQTSREARFGVELARQGKVARTSDELKGEIRYLGAKVEDKNGTYSPLLELDLDNRPKYAQCTCAFYNYNKLRQGPCRHMVALSLAGDAK